MTGVADFDVVVVGSGFGGSVMAYRLAKAGKKVCVLERGRRWPPGSFLRSPYRMQQGLWDPSQRTFGLFSIWSFRGLNAIVASGLGGGSLIYANVLIRKDERWFVREGRHKDGYEYWPVTRKELDPHYDRVEEMLDAQPYPFDLPPYNETPGTHALKAASARLGLEWRLPKLAVTFGTGEGPPTPGEPILDAPANLHGRTRITCRLCGECDIGCNYGSKNTLDYNYLSQAVLEHDAEIRTGCEVRTFEPRPGGGFTIHYVDRDFERERHPKSVDPSHPPCHTITTRKLVLAAGTLGTTYLLLKNRSALPHLGPRLGTCFSGNGDLLTFARGVLERDGESDLPLDGGIGPVITSAVRVPDALDGGEGRGFYIQDAGYPEFANWLLQGIDLPGETWRARAALRPVLSKLLLRRPDTDLSDEISALFGIPRRSGGVLPLLGIGRDIADGRMRLRDGMLDIDWRKRGRSAQYFKRLRATMRALANEMGARFLDNPIWHVNRVITVHPLGGCPMGRDIREGVVDAYGRAFIYKDLIIADGSVMPGPVGTNPSLTIAALADRFADRLIDDLAEERR